MSQPRPLFILLLLSALVVGGLTTGSATGQEEDEEEETPGAGYEESGSVVPLPPPRLRPPPGLELAPGAPGERATHHGSRAEAARLLAGVLSSRLQAELTGDSPSCEQARSLSHALRLTVDEAGAELHTAEALLVSVTGDDSRVAALRAFLHETSELLEGRRSEAKNLHRRLRRSGCSMEAVRSMKLPALTPPPPGEAGTAVLVEGSGPSRVLWVDGSPSGVTDSVGWGVLILSPGSHLVCEAEAKASTCRGGLTVDANHSVVLSASSP